MKADVFHKWFMELEARTRTTNNESELEACLAIYDGHLSHVNYTTIKLAQETRVTILKLLPHSYSGQEKLGAQSCRAPIVYLK